MSERILRWPEVYERVGLSRVQVWRLERAGLFPKRIQLGPNSVGWLESDIDEWIESRKTKQAPQSIAQLL